MITVENVTKYFGDYKVLDNINIHVEKGTIHGLIGENGAGKTTLLQAVMGIYTIEEGKILIDGESAFEIASVKEKMSYVADSNQFFKTYKIKELVNFFKDTYPRFSEEKFNQYNNFFKLDTKKKVRQLSKGMQMRLGIMLSLATNPEVLLLDEPTSGLDVIAKKQVLDLIIGEVEERQLTVLISSHHLNELEKLCDEVTFIHGGKVTYQNNMEGLKESMAKLQVVFEESAPVDLENWEELMCVERIGSVYYLITEKYGKALEEKLRKNGARIVEPIGLTLEEIFIYTTKAQGR